MEPPLAGDPFEFVLTLFLEAGARAGCRALYRFADPDFAWSCQVTHPASDAYLKARGSLTDVRFHFSGEKGNRPMPSMRVTVPAKDCRSLFRPVASSDCS
jgi:hypothetical protein